MTLCETKKITEKTELKAVKLDRFLEKRYPPNVVKVLSGEVTNDKMTFESYCIMLDKIILAND